MIIVHWLDKLFFSYFPALEVEHQTARKKWRVGSGSDFTGNLRQVQSLPPGLGPRNKLQIEICEL